MTKKKRTWKKDDRYPTHRAYDVRSYAKFERKTEPVSRGAEKEDVSYFEGVRSR